MDDHYGISDLRHFISRPIVAQFPPQPSSLPSPSDLFVAHHNHRGLSPLAGVPARPHPYVMAVMGREADMLNQQQQQQHQKYCNTTNVTATTVATATATANATTSCGFDGGDGGVARWPRQETLTLLEVRSRLDYKFKEANQKGPIWDELARIMCEEHGYQRTGKKCREKFENLYKYYKKTRDGKAGRQDGKHYRFFRQLDALYGDHNNTHHHHNNHHHYPITSTSEAAHHIAGNVHFHNNNPNIITSSKLRATDEPILRPTSASLSNSSSDYETSSSDNDVGGSIESDELKKKKGKKRSWKAKIKEFIDQQMRRIMEKQEAWLDKVMKALENREKESIEREQEWRNKEIERMEKEHLFWASERAWIEARDSAFMTALEKMSKEPCHQHQHQQSDYDHHSCRVEIIHGGHKNHDLLETEVTRLIQLRTSMESRFQQCGFSDEEDLWEDIAAKMSYFGYNRSASVCKEKWDSISKYFQEKDNIIIRDVGNKKRKENYEEVSINHNNSYNNDNICYSNHINEGSGGVYMNRLGGFTSNCEIIEPRLQLNERSSSHNSKFNANANNACVAAGPGSVMNDGCLRFFLGEGEGDFGNWEGNHGMKLNKNGVNHCV